MYLLLGIVLAGVIHELGHYWAALWFGHKLSFRFAWDKEISLMRSSLGRGTGALWERGSSRVVRSQEDHTLSLPEQATSLVGVSRTEIGVLAHTVAITP